MIRLYNALHVILLLTGFALCAWAYGLLPAAVPVQFGFDGSVSRMGGRSSLWVLYGIWLATAAVMEWARRRPRDTISMPSARTANASAAQSRAASATLTLINLLTGVLLLASLWTIAAAGFAERPTGTGPTAVLGLSLVYGVVVIFLAVRSARMVRGTAS